MVGKQLPVLICHLVVHIQDSPDDLPSDLVAYRAAGYPIIHTSVKSGTGLKELQDRMTGRITVFAGATGVGKSSLVNAMIPDSDLRVGKLGEKSGRGRHTTVSGLLIPIPGGGYLADTPGIQFVGLSEVIPTDLVWFFPEFRPFRPECRFADCLCRTEPGCAVRQAVEDGIVDADRYARYLELLEEAKATA